jgi:hypothetical protein
MKRTVVGTLLALALVVEAPVAAERWLHVRVIEGADTGVRLDVPLSVAEAMLPTIQADALDGDHLRWDGEDLDGTELRAILEALADAPDGDFVTVRRPGESVRVGKEGRFLLVHADDSSERVRVRVPIAAIEAMLAGDGSELDLAAGLQALAEFDGEDLVTIESDDAHVRIWIDNSERAD